MCASPLEFRAGLASIFGIDLAVNVSLKPSFTVLILLHECPPVDVAFAWLVHCQPQFVILFYCEIVTGIRTRHTLCHHDHAAHAKILVTAGTGYCYVCFWESETSLWPCSFPAVYSPVPRSRQLSIPNTPSDTESFSFSRPGMLVQR